MNKQQLNINFASGDASVKEFIGWAKEMGVKVDPATVSRHRRGKQGITEPWKIAYHCYFQQSKEKENTCEVEGCSDEQANAGGCWRDKGYWCVCTSHAQLYREGGAKPRMKKSAITREATRDQNGILKL